MRGVGFLSILLVTAALGACAGKSSGDDDDGGSAGDESGGTGVTGSSKAGKGGKAGATATGGSGGAGAMGGQATAGEGGTTSARGGSGGDMDEAGAPRTRGGAGGNGGAGGGAAGKAGAGGMGGNAGGAVYVAPGDGDTWQFKSGDPLNSTPPVLAPIDGGVVIAGSSADPATTGLTEFDGGITSEAFIARLGHDGKAKWSTPLKAAGFPWNVVPAANDYIVVAPYLPDTTQVAPYYVSQDIFLAKVTPEGDVVLEKTLDFEHEETIFYATAVAPNGDIFLAGLAMDLPAEGPVEQKVILAKCDGGGTLLWEKTFPNTGHQAYANSLIVLPDGDLIATGAFDAELDFGGDTEPLKSSTTLEGLVRGFLVRFTASGEPVWSEPFGGDELTVGTSLALMPGSDDFFLTGAVAMDLTLAGLSLPGVPFTPDDNQTFPPSHAFVARMKASGEGVWVERQLDSEWGNVVVTDGATVFVGGSVETKEDASDGAVYLTSYTANDGSPGSLYGAPSGDGVSSAALVLSDDALWVSGRFAGGIDFGAGTAFANSDAGVFLVRLPKSP